MSETPDIKKGLVGVYADISSISKVMPETNSLTYRGYAVQDLCENASFDETAYLLWNGELPNAAQLAAFQAEEKANRALSPALLRVIADFPKDAHPMDAIRTAVSFMGMEDPEWADIGDAAQRRKAMRLLAKIPTAVAAAHRAGKGQAPIAPDASLSFGANFFNMVFGKVPQPEVIKAFDVSMILYAEHSFNASTFTARVIASTLSDLYSAVTGAIGALKGALHGGANEAVMHIFDEIGSADNVNAWLDKAFAEKRKIMGFGHRVYKNGDSRVPTMKASLDTLIAEYDRPDLAELYRALETAMNDRKGIKPNLDYPSGPAYHLIGFDTEMFTPLFVMSRITGWTAHIMEQLASNSLIRPLSAYNGVEERHVTTQL